MRGFEYAVCQKLESNQNGGAPQKHLLCVWNEMVQPLYVLPLPVGSPSTGFTGRRKRFAREEPEKPKCADMINSAAVHVTIREGINTHTSYAMPMGGTDGKALRKLGRAKSNAKVEPIMGGSASRDLWGVG